MTKPWTILKNGDGYCNVGPDDGHGYIAKVRMRPTMTNNTSELEKAAHLIAAAPAFLKALEAIANIQDPKTGDRGPTRHARHIAKCVLDCVVSDIYGNSHFNNSA